MDNPKFHKTEKGVVINMMMITQMYKRSDGLCIVEFVGGGKREITEKEMERLYENFMFNVINI